MLSNEITIPSFTTLSGGAAISATTLTRINDDGTMSTYKGSVDGQPLAVTVSQSAPTADSTSYGRRTTRVKLVGQVPEALRQTTYDNVAGSVPLVRYTDCIVDLKVAMPVQLNDESRRTLFQQLLSGLLGTNVGLSVAQGAI